MKLQNPKCNPLIICTALFPRLHLPQLKKTHIIIVKRIYVPHCNIFEMLVLMLHSRFSCVETSCDESQLDSQKEGQSPRGQRTPTTKIHKTAHKPSLSWNKRLLQVRRWETHWELNGVLGFWISGKTSLGPNKRTHTLFQAHKTLFAIYLTLQSHTKGAASVRKSRQCGPVLELGSAKTGCHGQGTVYKKRKSRSKCKATKEMLPPAATGAQKHIHWRWYEVHDSAWPARGVKW